jgi:hypothetical protein
VLPWTCAATGGGLRSGARFRLADCADDAAAVLAHLGVPPVLAGRLLDGRAGHAAAGPPPPRPVAGFVLCATALDWSDARQKVFWRTMGGLRLLLGLFPAACWTTGMRLAGRAVAREQLGGLGAVAGQRARRRRGRAGSWAASTAAAWAGALPQPRAVVLTSRDRLVPPRKQRALAPRWASRRWSSTPTTTPARSDAERFVALLLRALGSLRTAARQSA